MVNRSGAALAAAQRASAELAALVAVLGEGTTAAAPEVIAAVEAAGRLMDAARVLATAPLAHSAVEAEKLGFASSVAAVATLAQVSERTARSRLSLAQSVSGDTSLTGAELPPAYPRVASALTAGHLGIDAAALITRELDKSVHRVGAEARAAVEDIMVNLGTGFDPTGRHAVPPISVDYLTHEVRTLGAMIDPDGARPREERADQRRAVWTGSADDDGLIPFGGRLEPELGMLFLGFIEAWRRSPRFTDASEPWGADDSRTPAQRRHDAFGEMLIAATAAEGAPQLGGQPVTVLVTVSADDLANPEGRDSDPIGTMAGSPFPVSRRRVEQFIDGNGYREIQLAPAGAVIGIGSPERCFTPKQTLGIAARDGYRCSTPGCTTPHTALQVHHVVPWREGGKTTTSNGILLCYWHHRRVDNGPWQYRMVDGLPHVRGPGIPEWTRLHSDLAYAA